MLLKRTHWAFNLMNVSSRKCRGFVSGVACKDGKAANEQTLGCKHGSFLSFARLQMFPEDSKEGKSRCVLGGSDRFYFCVQETHEQIFPPWSRDAEN